MSQIGRNDAVDAALARAIRRTRELGGYSIKEIASLLGVTSRTVEYWEAAHHHPSVLQLLALAVACGTRISALLAELDEPDLL